VVKVVGLVCSPRKGGNTEILVREVLAAVEEAGGETELITVAGKSLSGCDACETCLTTGECRIQDDMQSIHQAMLAADGIVFGTPAYFANVSSQAKAVMDRTYCMLFTKKLKNKVAAPVVATYRIGGAQVLSLLDFFFTNQRMLVAGSVIGYGWARGEVRDGQGAWGPSAMEEARSVGRSVVRLINRLKAGDD